MRKNFNHLRDRLSPAARERAHRLAQKYEAEMALDELRVARDLTCTDPAREVALVALARGGDREAEIGAAQYCTSKDGSRCDPRQEEAFGHQLAHDLQSRGAEGEAHGDLFLTRGRPCDEKVCDIGARNQQHETCHCHQDV